MIKLTHAGEEYFQLPSPLLTYYVSKSCKVIQRVYKHMLDSKGALKEVVTVEDENGDEYFEDDTGIVTSRLKRCYLPENPSPPQPRFNIVLERVEEAR